MKTIFLGCFIICFISASFSQIAEINFCGTMQNLERLTTLNPELEIQKKDSERKLRDYLNKAGTDKALYSNAVITIPVVVHVVWNTSSQNVSDVKINDMLKMLNQDFSKSNPDTNMIPAVWKPIAADTKIQFCLAQRDPNGAATNGILRVQTSVSSFSYDDKVKFTAQGGSDAWNTTEYFNIWICKYPGRGYAEFPFVSAATKTWGLVGDYQDILTPVFTHEIGHCFGLYHIWGDDNGACSGSDGINDTPNQGNYSQFCPPGVRTDGCSPSAPGIMYTNYMDGSQCANMFTNDQASVMNGVLVTTPYAPLTSSQGCVPLSTGLDESDFINDISIFPNPSAGIVHINIKSRTFGVEVTVHNSLGEIVYESEIKGPDSKIIIDLHDWAEGVYLVLLKSPLSLASKKIIVSN